MAGRCVGPFVFMAVGPERRDMAELLDLSKVKTDEELDFLGFKCVGHVSQLPRYRGNHNLDYLWCWVKDNGESVISLDKGNGYCTVMDFDLTSDDIEKGFALWAERERNRRCSGFYKDEVSGQTIKPLNGA